MHAAIAEGILALVGWVGYTLLREFWTSWSRMPRRTLDNWVDVVLALVALLALTLAGLAAGLIILGMMVQIAERVSASREDYRAPPETISETVHYWWGVGKGLVDQIRQRRGGTS